MECPFCLAENEKSMKERGYGRSFIPTLFNCSTHKRENEGILKKTGQIDTTSISNAHPMLFPQPQFTCKKI